MEIRGLSALVTGASGFIGGRLTERLATEEGVRVRAMVRDAKKAERLRKRVLALKKRGASWVMNHGFHWKKE